MTDEKDHGAAEQIREDKPDDDPDAPKLDESFEIISEKEKLLRDALVKVETDYIKSEVNNALCSDLIKFYKAQIKKEADKNAR